MPTKWQTVLPDKKILVKGGPKQYKTKAGLTGSARVYHQLFRLQQTAQKAAQKPNADAFAITLSDVLSRAVRECGPYLNRVDV
jgi:hypothetical protein